MRDTFQTETLPSIWETDALVFSVLYWKHPIFTLDNRYVIYMFLSIFRMFQDVSVISVHWLLLDYPDLSPWLLPDCPN